MCKNIRYYRHSETMWNKEGRLQGWQDSALTADGILQAKKVHWQPDIVFSSDLKRAVQSAKIMFPQQQMIESELLREIHMGNWQGKRISELQDDLDYQCYLHTPHLFLARSQESFQSVTERMLHFHEHLITIPHSKIAVVSHGVAIACLLCHLRGESYEELWQHMIPNTAYVELKIE